MNKDYDVIIGLEIHIQTKTESKMFCSCKSKYFEQEPNSQVCPVCIGLPGALPIPNKRAIEKCILLGLATNCKISPKIRFDRKHYFYPDLPKGYQISQYDNPICSDGYIMIKGENQEFTKIEIERIHQEEDVAKSFHKEEGLTGKNYSLIDFNKSGVPLIEIVTKPVIHSAKEAKEYATKVRQIARYLDISDADMEKGQMRCEPNISVQKKGTWICENGKILPIGDNKLFPKVEVKNIGSISAVEKSIEFEVKRLLEEIEKGNKIIQQTRGWNADKGVTEFQRSKETAEDYRYFPEPDIPVITVSEDILEKIKKELVELPETKIKRYVEEYKLSSYDAEVITAFKSTAIYFEKLLSLLKSEIEITRAAKLASNWLTGSVFSYLNTSAKTIDAIEISPEDLAELIKKVEQKELLNSKAKELLEKALKEGISLKELVNTDDNKVISDTDSLKSFASQILADNPKAVEDFKAGKANAIGFLVGQLMRITKGNANPQLAKQILEELINNK